MKIMRFLKGLLLGKIEESQNIIMLKLWLTVAFLCFFLALFSLILYSF